MADFNDIGIPRQLDWPRVRKLLTIGVFGALLHLTGDLILGWGVEDESLTGLFRTLSAYTATRDGGILASALLGLLGMTLEGLSLFGVYRLMAERSPRDAHRYRSGILGYLIFGACGFHVPTCALVFLGKQGLPEETLARFALYFLLPATALFWVFFLLLAVTQIAAFAKGRTPYPRWCWVFSPLVGGLAAQAQGFLGNLPLLNAIACAWLAIGCLWMFGGLLGLAKSAERRSNAL